LTPISVIEFSTTLLPHAAITILASNTATMKITTQLPMRLRQHAVAQITPVRLMHATACRTANVTSVLGTGPPPEPPVPTSGELLEKVARRRKQAEMLKSAKDIRTAKDGKGKSSGLKKRFWKDVNVVSVDGEWLV
jgi:ATP synthase F1 complex assembly factor 2